MIRPRFLAVASQASGNFEAARSRALKIASECEDLGIVLDVANLLVLSQGRALLLNSGRSGIIIGSLFCPGRKGALEAVGHGTEQLIANSRGAHLIDAYWGSYLAFLTSHGRSDILRAPFGELPCYYTSFEGAVLLASDFQLLCDCSESAPAVSTDALARYLLAEDVRCTETCLSGILELSGGERLAITGDGVEAVRLWSPWDHGASKRQLYNRAEAAQRVRDAVLYSVRTQSELAQGAVLRLSGGLDSSIVAAALATSDTQATCLNLVTSNPSGDERRYAQAVADFLKLPLVTRRREVEAVDIECSDACRLPRPTARSFAQETRRITEEIASEAGATIAFDGGGGDNVFCSLQSARPVADCIIAPEGRGDLLPTVRSVSTLAQVSAFRVSARAWKISRRRSPRYRFPLDTRFLASAVPRDSSPTHPWLRTPEGALPGKAAHVSLVMTAQSVVEGFDPQARLPLFSPLISQPVVEACLRVPSWLWFDDGLNRATARRAFADRLPPEVIRRRSKGTPDSFLIEIFERHRGKIREMLLDGSLAGMGLLDRPALAHNLSRTGPVIGFDYFRIMRLVDAEAWVSAIRGARAFARKASHRRY